LLDAKVPVFRFIYGIPPQEILEECRAKHVFTIGTAGDTPRAAMWAASGARLLLNSCSSDVRAPSSAIDTHKFIANGFDVRERISAITSVIALGLKL
jgi:hypothetical protein